MARYTGPKEKIERRLGEKLYLKGERSYSQKSAMIKKPYPPGMHGQRPSRKTSEFAQQLRSKQKVRKMYRLMEKQFKNYVKFAVQGQKNSYENILKSLEHRLDNVVFRSGLAQSRDQARQIVNHGHILVNGRKVGIPSYQVKIGDKISVREGSQRMPYFMSLVPQWIKKTDAPAWLEVDKDKMIASVKGQPTAQEAGVQVDDLQSIIEFYSR